MCLPSVIMGMVARPMKSIGGSPITGYSVTVLFYMLYYICLLHPLYRRRYAVVLVLVGSHLGMGFLLLAVVAVLHSH